MPLCLAKNGAVFHFSLLSFEYEEKTLHDSKQSATKERSCNFGKSTTAVWSQGEIQNKIC